MSRRVIVVLGMHRSGTSVITRALKTLGVDLGDNLLPPAPDVNDKGFWEDQEFNSINIELLKTLGRDWHSNEPIPLADFDSPQLSPLKQRAVELLRRKIEPTGLFGIKDPRACVCLPFWKGVFRALGVEASFVIAVRHPMSVAKSLRKRDGLEEIKSQYLWISHMSSSLLETEGLHRIVVDYDLLMDQPEAQLLRIAQRLNLRPPVANSSEMNEFKNEFLDSGLRHTRFSSHDPEIPKNALEAYNLLRRMARDELDLESKEVHEAFILFKRHIDEMSPTLRYMDKLMAQRDAALAERDAVTAQRNAVTAHRDAVIAERDAKERAIESLNLQIMDIFQQNQPNSLKVFQLYRRNKILARDIAIKSDLLSITLAQAGEPIPPLPSAPPGSQPYIERFCARFNEADYLLANPDALALVKSGEFKHGHDHWQAVGYLECLRGKRVAGFIPYDNFYDESAYLEANEDVETLIKEGQFLSGYDHWLHSGLEEFIAGKRESGFSVDPEVVRLNVVVFGTGEGGRLAKNTIVAKGWRVSRLVDNNPAMWGKTRFDLPVDSPKSLEKRDFELIVVASSVGRDSIFEQLDKMGFQHFYDYVSPLEISLIDGWDIVFHKNLKEWLENKRKKEPAPLYGRLTLPTSDSPLVSVVIPVHNQIEYTFKCLRSITKAPPAYPFEVIVVDDASSDGTADVLSCIEGLKVVRNAENLGFIRSCNKGASIAKGEYVHFLNNDTEVLGGWLDELVEIFKNHSDAGLAGSMLIYPDGRLQEAGGIIWNNASGWNYGRNDFPEKPEYNYVRQADYISGASIMVPASLFRKLGGFDERFIPAYYEDVDLAFSIRKAGYKTFYQPASQIIHFEGVTSGTDAGSGVKAYQTANRLKFLEKWSETLASHGSPGDSPFLERDRYVRGRILIVDANTPTPDKDAGSVMAFYVQKILVELGYKVTFVPDNMFAQDGYTQALTQIGVECLYMPYVTTLKSYLRERGRDFDFVFLYRVWTAHKHIKDVKRYCPQAKIIFDTVDLHHLREERQAVITGSAELLNQAQRTKEAEIGLIREADITNILSETEVTALHGQDPSLRLTTIPLILEIPGSRNPFPSRKDIVYIGGFDHTPNVDAVEYFVQDIWPLVRRSLPSARFLIIGSKMPDRIKTLEQHEGVIAVGFVHDLAEYFDHCKLTVAPLRFGAGIKGKIATSFSYGVPCVATSIATEGMGLTDGENVIVADTVESFAEKVVSIYNDEALWNRLSEGSLDFVTKRYSLQAGKKRLVKLLKSLGANPPLNELD